MNLRLRTFFSLAFLLCFLGQAYSQSLQITGKVTRKSNGEALSGATVNVKGTTTSTTTDASGNYSISVPSAGSVLSVSYAGTLVQEITVRAAGELNFELDNNTATTLDDVVVVGYGQQRKASVTGAISTVKSKEL